MAQSLATIPKGAVVIPVIGFATVSRFDLARRLIDSIDYPVEHLVIVDNSGTRQPFTHSGEFIKNTWIINLPHGLGANGAWNLIIKSTPHASYWVIPNDDSHFEPGALQTIAENVDTTKFNFVNVNPKWSCVIPTEGSVSKAGLWDEAFHPIYFDDDDYEWRMKQLGVEFNYINATVHHDNSSSLMPERNAQTFARNNALFTNKMTANDLGVRGWSLKVRRENRWD